MPAQSEKEKTARRPSILLVDDREPNLIALEATLKDLGPDLVKASSGQEALKLLFDRDFAVILLDVRMPGMDGFEAAELIRKRRRSRLTPIIFITAADASPDQIARGYSAGAVDYIFKPFMPEVLKAKVRIFLELFRKTEELRESEVRLRTLVSNVPGAIYRRRAEPPWKMLFLSEQIGGLPGYSAAEFVDRGRAYDSIIHPEDLPVVSDALQMAVLHGTHYSVEYRIVPREGRMRWVLDRGQGVAGDSGGVNYLDGVLLEITDRKIAEESLSELTGRLMQVQDEERRKISRELQDKTSPLLTGLIGKLYQLRHRTRDLDTLTSKSLDESLKLAEDTASVVRNTSHLLHPHLLDENGLLASLRWYLSGFTNRTGLPVEMEFPEELARLPHEAEIALFRVVQERLADILRQPGSKGARVQISVNRRDLTLVIGDQDRSIPTGVKDRPKERPALSEVAVAGVRRRMEQIGGRLEFSSNGSGAKLTAILPLEAVKK